MIKSRGRELAPDRKLARSILSEDPQISGPKLAALLKERGHEVSQSTCYSWVARWRKGQGYAPSERSQLVAGTELARKIAFSIWSENPQIKRPKLMALLKERGHEVSRSTCYSWLGRFRKGQGYARGGNGHAPSERAKLVAEMTPVRKLAFSIWSEDPQINGPKLAALLKERGHEVSQSTCYIWVARWRKGQGYARSERAKLEASVAAKVEAKRWEALTWEQIIKSAPDIETLSVLFFQGVMEKMGEKDDAYEVLRQENLSLQQAIADLKRELEEVTGERNRMMRNYNELLAKKTIGTLTLDQTLHRLVPKPL